MTTLHSWLLAAIWYTLVLLELAHVSGILTETISVYSFLHCSAAEHPPRSVVLQWSGGEWRPRPLDSQPDSPLLSSGPNKQSDSAVCQRLGVRDRERQPHQTPTKYFVTTGQVSLSLTHPVSVLWRCEISDIWVRGESPVWPPYQRPAVRLQSAEPVSQSVSQSCGVRQSSHQHCPASCRRQDLSQHFRLLLLLSWLYDLIFISPATALTNLIILLLLNY